MSAALISYLERLVHPARKAYATAYAAYILEGATKPKATGLDRDTAAKIAHKVERYSRQNPMTTGGDAPQTVATHNEGLSHLPDAVRAYAAEHGDAELLGLVDAFISPLEPNGESETLADYYRPEVSPAFIETAEVDVLDLTGLEPELARELALKLARWNGGGKVYSRRNGRRYLHGDVRRIDLNDPTVQSLPNYEDLQAVVHERGVRA